MQVNTLIQSAQPDSKTLQNNNKAVPEKFKTLLQQISTSDNIAPAGKTWPAAGNNQKNAPVYIGSLSHDTPTVSELFYKTPLKQACWDILAKTVNANKPFRQMAADTKVFLDPKTLEIIWNENGHSGSSASAGLLMPAAPGLDAPKEQTGKTALKTTTDYKNNSLPQKDLNQAVQQFIGTKYSQMDCYELLVKGMENIGLRYNGSNSLKQFLVDKAQHNGFAANYYLNGEGITSATGKNVFKKTMVTIKDAHISSQKTMDEMKQVLQHGQILSFSTRTRGHTGIISKQNGQWTFINSGYMDHNIAGKNGEKAVGEETLQHEINNWFKRARKEGEALSITLGSVDPLKLAFFQPKPENSLSEKA